MRCESAVEQVRAEILEAVTSIAEHTYMQQTLASLNSEAVTHVRANKHLDAVVTYGKLFTKLRKDNLTHAELYACYNNRAASHLCLHMYEEALQDAEKARKLAETALKRTTRAFNPYVKSFSRKAGALIGLERYREAGHVAEQGLKLDPFNLDLKQASEQATQGILRDLLTGRGKEILALPNAEPTQRITYHPHSAPLHKIKTENMLPNQLLTPFQAESDHHVRDTYNYITVQTDIAMPKRHLKVVEDTVRQSAWKAAIIYAVKACMAEDKDCRVLDLASGAGLHAMVALGAGAHHVTAVERWLYLSLACKETLTANGFQEDRFRVVYKRATDLALQKDVPILCNLLLCDILDEGLLASGMIPAVRHCLDNLLTTDACVIPASATAYAQAVEIRTTEVCGFDMSSINRHRWHPSHTAGIPLTENMFTPLSEAMEVWHFDMLSPPEESDRKTLDVTFTQDGRFNAVVFWYELHLTRDIVLSTGPAGIGSGMKSLGPVVQYLAGEMSVEQGIVMPLLASHNTVRMRFDVENTEYLYLAKPDATFPALHFSMLADHKRNEAYQAAIARVIKRKKASAGSAHVVDLGTGSGLLAIMAGTAGADSVVACELHESLCNTARQSVAANGLSDRVSIVHRDIGLLQRGREIRALGANVALADIFDAGLVGNNFLYLLEMAKKNVLQPGASIVPCAASLYVMGINLQTLEVAGHDLSDLNKYRWDKGYETCQLDELSHTCLTKPCKVFEYLFEGERKGRGRDNIVKLDVIAEGVMNAVAFWFDLHLDEEESLCSGPSYVMLGGNFTASASLHSLDHTAEHSPAQEAAATAGNCFTGTVTNVKPDLETHASFDAMDRTDSLCTFTDKYQNNKSGSHVRIAEHGDCTVDSAQDSVEGDSSAAFVPATAFTGAKNGLVFKLGHMGLGYYPDTPHADLSIACKAQSALIEPTDSNSSSAQDISPSVQVAAPVVPDTSSVDYVLGEGERAGVDVLKGEIGPAAGEQEAAQNRNLVLSHEEEMPVEGWAAEATADEEGESEGKGRAGGEDTSQAGHYWGQALQYLDCTVQVTPGRKVLLLARRDGAQVRFSLRAGTGSPVAVAPWKEEWGGGSSVENPHFQRVHYCELLVQDFLMRVKSGRFPSIEKDMQMLQAHCGSLLLDPAVLAQVYHEMVVLERIHSMPEFGAGASLQAITSQPLMLH